MLDEPSSGMDPVTRRKLWDMILEKKGKQECGVILTTHFMEEAGAVSSSSPFPSLLSGAEFMVDYLYCD